MLIALHYIPIRYLTSRLLRAGTTRTVRTYRYDYSKERIITQRAILDYAAIIDRANIDISLQDVSRSRYSLY